MADIWYDVDAALSEVPINLIALTDDTDFKSREESVTYNQAGLDLVWNFVTTAGAMSQTAVTPTDTAGNYDFVNQGNGMYSIEIPASGGASINNDTEGFGWFTGFATGILPWRSPVFGFRAAGLNNVLIDTAYSATRGLAGTALPDAAADDAGGLPISDAGGFEIDEIALGADLQDVEDKVDVIAADTTTEIPATLASILEDTGTTLDTLVKDIPTNAELATALGTADDAVLAVIATAQGNITSILEDTGTTLDTLIKDIPTNAELATALGTADDAVLAALTTVEGKIDTIDNFLDTEVAAILAETITHPTAAEIVAAIGASVNANAAVATALSVENSDTIYLYRDITNVISFAALGDVSAYTAAGDIAWFTVKENLDDADSSSILQIKTTSFGDSGAASTLTYVNAAAPTASDEGSFLFSNYTTGAAAATLKAVASADLPIYAATPVYWDVKVTTAAGVVTILAQGTSYIYATATKSIT